MRFYLLLSLLFLAACGKNEEVLEGKTTPSAFEEKNFVSFKHEKGDSLLRRKLLNQIVEESLKDKPLSSEHEITKGDEFIFRDGIFELSEKDKNIFKEKEKYLTKLIVSYEDSQEIFFLPDNIPLNLIADQLHLTPQKDSVFRFVNSHIAKTQRGNTLYLVSFNKMNLVDNDKYFYQQKLSGLNNINDRILNFHSSQEIEIKVKYQYFVQTSIAQDFNGPQKKCSRDMLEAGLCNVCSYSKRMPGPQYEAQAPGSLADLGFIAVIDGKEFSINELSHQNLGDGYFSVHLDLKKLATTNNLSLRLQKTSSKVTTILSNPYNVQGNCSGIPMASNETYQSRSELTPEIIIKGRGIELLSRLGL